MLNEISQSYSNIVNRAVEKQDPNNNNTDPEMADLTES